MKKNIHRCIREYPKKNGSFTYYAEVRRHPGKPIRKKCRTLTEAKNWVKKTESLILDGGYTKEARDRHREAMTLIRQCKNLLKKFS